MKKSDFFTVAYALGLAVAVWVAATALPTNPLVLVMTLIIAAVFTYGFLELRAYRLHTSGLCLALQSAPSEHLGFDAWLLTIPAPLQQAVRQRIEGERAPPPGPAISSYLVGLLVMLGMLGTFLGMVVTLSGTAFALQNLTDIQGIRDAFADPIKGLGLAFGASVAGVATSAMLGLMSTLARRERLAAWSQIDVLSHSSLHALTPAHHRHQTLVLLQKQAEALPQLIDLMGQWTTKVEGLQIQLNEQMLSRQESHFLETRKNHEALAESMERSFHHHLTETMGQVGASLQAMARETFAQLGDQASRVQERLIQTHQASNQLHQEQVTQMQTMTRETLTQLGDQADRVHQLLLQTHQDSFVSHQKEIARSVEQIDAIVAQHLGQLAASLEAPLAQLIEISNRAPQAAAEVIGELRQRINASMARDNELLHERAVIMEQLSQTSRAFTDQVQQQGAQMGDLAGQIQASALEVGDLSRAFGSVAQSLIDLQQKTADQLQQTEMALNQSMLRSDEQMAYYLAQAREVIELSLSTQKPMLEALEKLTARSASEEGV